MKIDAIRGRNLASLEGDFGIDFTAEPLLSAGIFAISGPTGAGKSTLLDAMCLALFARTPRTDQAKENNVKLRDVNEEVLPQSDPRFLLRRGTASGYAEVDFVALDRHRYRARWWVGRARDKESGRLQAPKTTLFNLDTGVEESGTRSELQSRIVELIGLTFEQFTRSVLLAQNDFSTFLKAEQGEKASLLEKLTGTELYSSISRLIFERYGKAKEAFDAIQVRIQGIELVGEEEEAALHTHLADAEATLLRLEKARAEQQALQEAVRTAEQQIATRQTQQKEAVARLEQAIRLLDAARRDYDKGMSEQQQSETAFQALKEELQQARRLDVQLDGATRILSDAEQQLQRASVRLKEAEENHRAALSRQQLGSAEIARLTSWRERYRSKAGIAEQLSALLLHIDAASAAHGAMEKSNRTITAIREAASKLTAQLATLNGKTVQKRAALAAAEQTFRTLEKELKRTDPALLDQEIGTLRQQREQLLVEQARLAASGNIQELREKLQEGQPCPVCGSLEHPLRAVVVSHHPIDALTIRLQQLTSQKDTYTTQSRQFATLQQQQLALHKELAEAEAACTDLVARQQLSATQLEHEEAAVKEQSVLLTRSLLAADQLFGGNDWQKSWQQNPDAFRQTLTDFTRQWHQHNEQLHELERQQSAHQAACQSLASFLPSLSKVQAEAAALYEAQRSGFVSLQAERAKLLGGRHADAVEQEHIRRMEVLKERLGGLLALQTEQSGIAQQSRGITDQITHDLAEVSAQLSLRQAALNQWQADYTASSAGETLASSLLRVTQQQSELTFRLRTQAANKAKVAGMQEALGTCRSESERWAKLNELAGSADGAKFRRIAQGYTLDLLLSYANVQLRELSRRYRLERVPETLALQVIDRDMCDEVRTVHSLSGGESFLVSLALALGLSSLSSNRMKVESLFIDEGFGSLDADTLRVAMDALESLRTQGRKIGVISHVQEMTERIPVQIRVSRAGNGRSYLEVI